MNQNMDMDYNARVKMGHKAHTHRHTQAPDKKDEILHVSLSDIFIFVFFFSSRLLAKVYGQFYTVADSNLHSQKGKSICPNLLQRPESRRWRWLAINTYVWPSHSHAQSIEVCTHLFEWHSITTQLACMCLLAGKNLTQYINYITEYRVNNKI